MAEVIWTEPAIADLDAIADYTALDKPDAAKALVRRIVDHVEQLAEFPESGSRPREFQARGYRQIVEPLCRVFYRVEVEQIFVVHVMRAEMRLLKSRLTREKKKSSSARSGPAG